MERKNFRDRWKDKKYQAKFKLSLYGVFILFIIVLVLASENDVSNDDNEYFVNSDNFIARIEIDNDVIRYDVKGDMIEREYNGVIDIYKLVDSKYYKKVNDNYVLVDISYVFDRISYDYVNIDIINNYLLYSKIKDNKYIVYLKDILLDSDSNDYIEFDISDKVIKIDYTNLYNYLSDKSVGKLIVNIEYY